LSNRQSVAFAKVVDFPEGLKIQPMKTGSLLGRVFQIKPGTRADMVNMPLAVISPGHTRLKMKGNPNFQKTQTASN
jgi:hypothetical protein